jgi:phage gp29-like protein
VRDLVPKPREWFVFDVDGALCFRGEDAIAGDKVHPFKMMVSRHFPTFKNPYGLRLLSRCLFPVAFKRGGIEFMMRFAEKFGMPWVVGEARPGALEPERRDMLASLSAMVRDAVAVVSGGSKVHIESVEGKATGGIHLSIVGYMDAAIAQVIQGQTLTQEIGTTGSYAASQTHYDVLTDYAEADQTLVVTAMNDLAWMYGQVNAPDALTPVFAYVEPEDLEQKAKLGRSLYALGARFKTPYFESFGLTSEEFSVAAVAAGPENGEAFAAGEERFTPDQQAVERLVAEALKEGGQAVRAQASRIVDLMERAESWEDAELLLLEAFPDLDNGDFQKAVEAAQVAADLLGRYAVRLEIGRA